MAMITIFTPTYNRAHTLPRLYDSLCNQTCKDFEWLIVDDGSSDSTDSIVCEWSKNNNGFSISYFKKENGGKPRAINYAVERAEGEFFFIVDSDDYLTSDALEKMTKWCNEIRDINDIIGVGAAQGSSSDTYIKKIPSIKPGEYADATNLQRADFNINVDMCEAYKTELFKKFPMAEWPGENFAPEQIAINSIALAGYKVRWHSDIVYISSYRDDGLTKGVNSLIARNPMGYAMMWNHKLLYPNLSFKKRYHAACMHIAMSIIGKHTSYIFKSNRKLFTLIAIPHGIYLSFKLGKKYKNSK